jgi:hypothetical protein
VRRVLAYVVIMLGFLFLFLAPFLHWYAVPRLQKAPLDKYDKIVATGFGKYFNTSPKILRLVGPVPMENIQIFRGDPSQGTDEFASYDEFNTLRDLQNGNIVQATKLTVAFDRVTGYAVHCCGEDPREQGLTLKFPFGSEKTTYPLYDNTGMQAYPVSFVREGDIQGLKVYVYQGSGGPTVIGHLDVSGELAGVPDQDKVTADISYQQDTTTWIEPETGAVIKGSQHAVQYLSYQGKKIQPLADLHLTYDDATVTNHVDDSKQSLQQLHVVKNVIPIYGPILGLILVVVGFLLLGGRRTRRERTAGTASQPTAAEESTA